MEILSLQRNVVVGGRTYRHNSLWYLNIGYFEVAPYLTVDTIGGWLFVDIAYPRPSTTKAAPWSAPASPMCRTTWA